MIILKHVEHRIQDRKELDDLLTHLDKTTSSVQGVKLERFCFSQGKDEFVLILECASEERYLKWRDICPPPAGARDWYEIFLTAAEVYPY